MIKKTSSCKAHVAQTKTLRVGPLALIVGTTSIGESPFQWAKPLGDALRAWLPEAWFQMMVVLSQQVVAYNQLHPLHPLLHESIPHIVLVQYPHACS